MIIGHLTKQPSEKFPITVTFAAELASSESVSSATVTARNSMTNESSSLIVLSGAVTVNTPNVTQTITGGVNGTRHVLTFKATTSLGNIYEGEIELLIKED